MTFDLWLLLAATALGLVHVSLASFIGQGQNNRQDLAGRLYRAQRNFLETFPLFAACVLIVHAADAAGALSWWGGVFYLGGRLAYLPVCAFGMPGLRTMSWNTAILGLVFTGLQLFVV